MLLSVAASCAPTPLTIDFSPQSVCSLFRAAPNVVEADVTALTGDQVISVAGQSHLATRLSERRDDPKGKRPVIFVAVRLDAPG